MLGSFKVIKAGLYVTLCPLYQQGTWEECRVTWKHVIWSWVVVNVSKSHSNTHFFWGVNRNVQMCRIQRLLMLLSLSFNTHGFSSVSADLICFRPHIDFMLWRLPFKQNFYERFLALFLDKHTYSIYAAVQFIWGFLMKYMWFFLTFLFFTYFACSVFFFWKRHVRL